MTSFVEAEEEGVEQSPAAAQRSGPTYCPTVLITKGPYCCTSPRHSSRNRCKAEQTRAAVAIASFCFSGSVTASWSWESTDVQMPQRSTGSSESCCREEEER